MALYLQRPEIWPDFHDSLIADMRGALQPKLRPRYAALIQDRPYVVEHQRPVRPDVSVIQTHADEGSLATAAAAEADRPGVVELVEEEIRLHAGQP